MPLLYANPQPANKKSIQRLTSHFRNFQGCTKQFVQFFLDIFEIYLCVGVECQKSRTLNGAHMASLIDFIGIVQDKNFWIKCFFTLLEENNLLCDQCQLEESCHQEES